VSWAGTPNGSVVVGNYAVDPNTGDVFSATKVNMRRHTRRLAAGSHLQFFCAIDLAEIAVECAERQVTGLSGDFE